MNHNYNQGLLVLPDIHNRVESAERLIAKFPERQVVCLGDYFDDYHDTVEDARLTAEWLRYSLGRGRIHLMGNHDLPYRWNSQHCPGYTLEKRQVIQRTLKGLWGAMRLVFILPHHHLRPLVLSHAGLTLTNLFGLQHDSDLASATRFRESGRLSHLRALPTEEYLRQIKLQERVCLEALGNGHHHHWLNQGSRMGQRNIAGPLWLDIDDMRSPLPGIDQIVGHTHVLKPRRMSFPNLATSTGDIWYIDGGGCYAALVDQKDNGLGGCEVVPIWAKGDKAGTKL